MENKTDAYKDIPGWGMDADPRNEPTYPMKHYTGDDHQRIHWERPPLQKETVEMLKSVERPHLTAAYGTSSPPMGLSGNLRRYAFRFSESDNRHWMTLVLADRVNMVEGLIADIKQGYFPNVIKEMGWDAEWRYNRKGIVKKAAIAGLAAMVIVMLLRTRNQARKYRNMQ